MNKSFKEEMEVGNKESTISMRKMSHNIEPVKQTLP